MDSNSIQKRLDEALLECARLKQENKRLRNLLGLPEDNQPKALHTPEEPFTTSSTSVTNDSTTDLKVALFRSLFRGREDLYPVRWETKNGKAGYSPACRNEWNRTFCAKPRIRCAQCEHREFLQVTDRVIYDHLAGKHTIGVYPLLQDDACWFLAADFDKSTWQEDIAEYLETCRKVGVPAVLERSRSGKGGHVWIFFSEPVAASIARKVGCYLLTSSR